jgi:hypothetical protein
MIIRTTIRCEATWEIGLMNGLNFEGCGLMKVAE